MYAIIETGGKQYRVEQGKTIDVELVEVEQGGMVEFRNVLFLNNDAAVQVGAPYVPSSCVRGELIGVISGPKELAFKYKRRKGIRRKVGHRQDYSRVKIVEIITA